MLKPKTESEGEPLLEVRDLCVTFHLREGVLRALENVSFTIERGEILGIVGESGCGKSITAASILRILPWTAKIERGQLLFRGEDGSTIDLATLDPKGKTIREIRGRDIAMVFQEPMTAFSPVHTIGNQMMEVLRLHRGCSRAEARRDAIAMLDRVGMPKAARRIDAYPFQLSGGMRQRAMIAMALLCRPRLLIADEPTTALDVTIEAQILELLRDLQEEFGMAVMMITHDLSVIAEMARNVMVMYLGEDVEYASTPTIFFEPKHPYTRELLASVPKLGRGTGERLHTIRGSVPNLYERPNGCPFHPRCREAIPGRCEAVPPPVVEVGPRHRVRCHLYAPGRVAAPADGNAVEMTEMAGAEINQ